MHFALLRDNEVVKVTWLLSDVTVLRTILMWKSRRYITEITISEASRGDNSKESLWIPSNI
jgi:hypothetical protein